MSTRKYNPFGGINPVWIAEQTEKREREEFEERLKLMNQYLNSTTTVQYVHECSDDECEDTLDELEAKFQFLKSHSDSKEDFELAKMILNIVD